MPARESPYSGARIKSGLRFVVLGKVLTSIAGIGTLLMVVRGLSIAEFAAYSILIGLVDVLLVVTAVGTTQVITRFVPEAHYLHLTLAVRRLLAWTLGIRLLVLPACVGVLALMTEPFATMLGLAQWQGAFQLYLLVVVFRTANNTLFQVLEAMLRQAAGQSAFAAVTVARFAGVAYLYGFGDLALFPLIAVEVAAEVFGLVLMAAGVFRAVQVSADFPPDAAASRRWFDENRRRILAFGAKGYLQVLVIMPFSGVVNRLVVGGQLAVNQVALFGFGQSIFDLMQRYLPAQFFAGVIRPVMAARFSAGRGFDEAAVISNLILKINLILIGAAACVVYGGDAQMLAFVTNHKYGAQAVPLLLLMCLLMALESWRHVLDQLSHTVERYGFLIVANGVLGSSLALGLYLLPRFGVLALPLANCVGLLIANQLVSWWLGRTGYRYRTDGLRLLFIFGATLICFGAASAAGHYVDNWAVRVLLVSALYAGLLASVPLFNLAERQILASFRPRRAVAG